MQIPATIRQTRAADAPALAVMAQEFEEFLNGLEGTPDPSVASPMTAEAFLADGFGRLIRTADDEGMVGILDPRVKTKRYGRLFLDSLPECELLAE